MKLWEAAFVVLIGAALAQEQVSQPALTDDQRKAQQLLKKTVEERQRNNPHTATNAIPKLTQAEMEQQYLAGKITAKQFQQYLRQHPSATPPMSADQEAEAVQMLRMLTAKTNATAAAPAPAPVKVTPPPADPATEPATPAITDVESKIQALEKLKEAREKASATNAPAPTPKTKREKLDALLKQFVEGKISDAEYKAQRAKLIAEPD